MTAFPHRQINGGPAWHRVAALVCAVLLNLLAIGVTTAQQGASQQGPTTRFGGGYEELDARRQLFVNDWVARLAKVTGQNLEPGPFYDDMLSVSTKTTFEAVTHALLGITLTDKSGANMGDALTLVDRIDTVRGEVTGALGDRQFRMYVRLKPDAINTIARSQEFKRGADNAVYHKGYPLNYREQGGTPSVQFSVALDRRRADVDVDYRSSSFPVGLFNGHLTASNSDVRAGNNYDRHINRWTGFQNWWRGFFGARHNDVSSVVASSGGFTLPKQPRAGDQKIDVMVNDFLNAWLVEGDIVAAMGYVSERAYACLAGDDDNPVDFDRGIAPFQLMVNLKSAHDELRSHASLDQVVVGMSVSMPALRLVPQPRHAQFVVYSVPDDIAASFDCESQLTLGDPKQVKRAYGKYFGSTFYVNGRRDYLIALLWAMDGGYWKIVSWKVGADEATTPEPEPVPVTATVHVKADPALVQAGRGFLESWLVRKDYDAAFGYLSPEAYACYDLERDSGAPAATSREDAGRKLRAALETAGNAFIVSPRLDNVLAAPEPSYPAVRVMDHPLDRVFSLMSIPNALADAVECDARINGVTMPDPLPLEYGEGFGMTVQFKTRSGDAPVLRLLWRKEGGAWRITSYGVETP